MIQPMWIVNGYIFDVAVMPNNDIVDVFNYDIIIWHYWCELSMEIFLIYSYVISNNGIVDRNRWCLILLL